MCFVHTFSTVEVNSIESIMPHVRRLKLNRYARIVLQYYAICNNAFIITDIPSSSCYHRLPFKLHTYTAITSDI